MKPKKIINYIVTIFCLCVFYSFLGIFYPAKAAEKKNQDIEATAAVDKSSIQIGDKITYSITVRANRDIEVEFPQAMPEKLSGFAIKDFGLAKRSLFGKNIFKQWYLLDTYVSGEHVIPQYVVKYRVKGQTEWHQLSTNEVKLNVKSVLDNAKAKNDIRDIRGPKSLASYVWLYVLMALIILFVIAGVFIFIILKKKKGQENVPPIPAHIIAYEALDALEKKDYIKKGKIKAYYTELSDIVRHYLENRFNIRAPEMTTEEFLIKVKEDNALSIEHKGLLREFLSNCDLVKFAKYQPAVEEANLSLSLAKRLIDQTKEEAKVL